MADGATLLTDTLQPAQRIGADRACVCVPHPRPQPTRPYLKEQVSRAVAHYIELPALAAPDPSLPARLF